MKVLIYEFLTGGGLYSRPAWRDPQETLLREGSAMVRALVDDFCRIPNHHVTLMWDRALPTSWCGNSVELVPIGSEDDELHHLTRLSAASDGTILIAPECDGLLLDRVRWVEAAGGRLLSPNSQLVAWTTDKQRTCERLEQAGLPVPRGCRVTSGEGLPSDFSYPAILKPLDGAGSLGVRMLLDHHSAQPSDWTADEMRLEAYWPGTAASISLLLGPAGAFVLPPCTQRFHDPIRFGYDGGGVIDDADLIQRARRIALQVVPLTGNACGYMGIDLVLGDQLGTPQDAVIEINPRLTSSYLGLRRATDANLAELWLRTAKGDRPMDSIRWTAVQW